MCKKKKVLNTSFNKYLSNDEKRFYMRELKLKKMNNKAMMIKKVFFFLFLFVFIVPISFTQETCEKTILNLVTTENLLSKMFIHNERGLAVHVLQDLQSMTFDEVTQKYELLMPSIIFVWKQQYGHLLAGGNKYTPNRLINEEEKRVLSDLFSSQESIEVIANRHSKKVNEVERMLRAFGQDVDGHDAWMLKNQVFKYSDYERILFLKDYVNSDMSPEEFASFCRVSVDSFKAWAKRLQSRVEGLQEKNQAMFRTNRRFLRR